MARDTILAKVHSIVQTMGIPNPEEEFKRGWVDAFKVRHGIKQFFRHGDSASVSREQVAAGRQKIIEIISQYSLKDVYNIDETDLFWRVIPNKTLANRKQAGMNDAKTRMTFAFIANADG